ncbi:MAG TPA: amidohydrolase family protein [Luteitalea sp.]|nr:amidohydrolase family protein [Luteitalea sp.]
MKLARLRVAALGLACVVGATTGPSAQPVAPIAIRNARLVPVSGPPIDAGTIVLANGLIRAVGARVDVPAEAVVIDGTGLTVYPGLFDAFTDLGLGAATTGAAGAATPRPAPRPIRGPQDRPATTPWVQAADEFRADDRRIETWRSGGITTVVTAPRGGVFPGQAAVINLSGERREDVIVRSAAAVPLVLTPPGAGNVFPGSLMGVYAYVRQVFLDTRHATDASRRYDANPRGKTRPEHDRSIQALQGALQAKTPFLVPASSSAQIDRVLTFGRELEIPVVVYGAHEGYAAAARLAKARVPVLVSAHWPEKARDGDPDADELLSVLELRDKAPRTPAALAEQKVPFAFYSDGLSGPSEYLANVRKAVKAGLAADTALRALTLDAAQLYGVQDRLGSLEAGKIANLVVVQGDLLGDKSTVRHVFVDGRRFEGTADATTGSGSGARPSGRGGPSTPPSSIGGAVSGGRR